MLDIKRDLERTIKFMFPVLIKALLLILLAYGVKTNYFHQAFAFYLNLISIKSSDESFADTAIALLAGLVIFLVVFTNHLMPIVLDPV